MSSSVAIDAPRETVWEVFSHAAAWPEWSRVCLEVREVPDALWRPGSMLWFRLRMAGVGVPFHVFVTDSRPERLVAWESTKFTITATRTFRFDVVDGRTLVTDRKLFRSAALPIALFYPRPLIRNMTESWLDDLKRESERRWN